MQNLTEPLSIKCIDITDDDSVLVVGDANHNINIYNKNVDRFDNGDRKDCGDHVRAVDITGDGQWLYSVCTRIGSKLYKYQLDSFVEKQTINNGSGNAYGGAISDDK